MKTSVPMPQLTLTMVDGVVLRWLVKTGENVAEGQSLLEIETDKTAVEVTSPRAGRVVDLVAAEGERVDVGEPIAVFEVSETVEPMVSESTRPVPAVRGVSLAAEAGNSPRKRVSPVAARLAREHGVDLERLVGSGAGGLIVEADVRRALQESPRNAQSTDKEEIEVPLSPVRRRIAERMLLSRTTTATVTTVVDVDIAEVKSLRQRLQFSYTVAVVRAAALALRQFPYMNSELRGETIVLKQRVHVGVAVSLDDGLIVPVIRNADTKGLTAIATEMEALSTAARSNTLSPEQVAGGTFTVTNSGVYGSLLFTPALNYPQSAILGMGKVADTPVARDGGLFIRPVMYLSLSYEHRVVDGAVAVKFLQEVKRTLEHPDETFVGSAERK